MALAVGMMVLPALPARALLAPKPQLSWRVGYSWSFTEASHGLDWGVGVRVPLQPSELGLVSLDSSVQATWPGYQAGDWEFRIGARVDSPRPNRPPYGLFYSVRRFEGVTRPQGSVTGLSFQLGSLVFGYYPGVWNPNVLEPSEAVATIEPQWSSGVYLHLRWALLPQKHSVRLAFGIEENW